MPTNTSAQALAQQIEDLVARFIADSRGAATAALNRAFLSTVKIPAKGPRTSRDRPKRKLSPKRSTDEMTALSERLYVAICANPGQSMSSLAPVVGVSPRVLQVPRAKLKEAGRIRTVGSKQYTRYFPMLKNVSKSG